MIIDRRETNRDNLEKALAIAEFRDAGGVIRHAY